MLHSIKALRGFAVATNEGEVGRVRDVYFDDSQWVIRYFVVDTGGWPRGDDVLLSPRSGAIGDWSMRALHFTLTRRQIENSPGVDTAKPVSRQYEEEFAAYYGYPYYWAGPDQPSAIYPGVVERKPLDEAEKRAIRQCLVQERARADPHLRSSAEVIGYRIHAMDRQIGHVEDFLFDETDWSIRQMVVGTRNWLPGRLVLIAPHLIKRVDWDDKSVFVGITRTDVEHSPAYDPGA